ncbi:MAG TPA: fibronectin type III domain-containing protein [Nitrospira sp.]|nr:fibronectin type III domain-containing protein [Nitrospira sp.]
MAQTTLSVCSVRTIRASALRLIVLAVVTTSMITGCGSGDGGGISFDAGQGGNGSAAPTGSASASLAWDPVGNVLGYIIHYGTQSPNSQGSCAYAQSLFSSTPSATVTGLSANTTYYFAVSAYNGLESACSAEVTTVTQSV